MMIFLLNRFRYIGKIPLCNGIPSRAPHIFGFCFPLCYRCTAIFIAFFITLYLKKKTYIHHIKFYMFCMLPMIIDGCLQTFFFIESTNMRRIITGSLFGYGIGMIVVYMFQKIDVYFDNRKM